MTKLSDMGEQAVIKLITTHLSHDTNVIAGPGDDCAVVRLSEDTDLLLTSDPVIEDVHFNDDVPAEFIGHKAAGRVLSDIAAMGGTPRWILINISAPPDTEAERLEAITKGAAKLAQNFSTSIAGGDLSKGEKLELNVFGVGTVPAGEAVMRSGAHTGDSLWVTGSLGGSRRSSKHYSFEPRVSEGILLRNFATSMIDVTDGLATDLRHLAAMSSTGFQLLQKNIPTSSDAAGLEGALTDGEDFELLFTLPAEAKAAFLSAWKSSIKTPVSEIGSATQNKDIIEIIYENGNIRTLTEKGYQHF